MNTSFLSPLPAAPAPIQSSAPRSARAGRPALEIREQGDVEESESIGDSDKADAFGEMLAAMISVTAPVAETPAETVKPTAGESIGATTTDVPRDGAGSPLFTSGFATSVPEAGGASATSTSSIAAESLFPATTTTGESQVFVETPSVQPPAGTTITDAAAAELASLAPQPTDAESETVGSTFALELADVPVEEPSATGTPIAAQGLPEADLPIVAASESTAPTTELNEGSQPTLDVVAVGDSVESPHLSAPANEPPSQPTPAPVADTTVPTAEAAIVDAKAAVATPEPAATDAVPEAAPPTDQPAAVPPPESFEVAEQPYEQPQVDPRVERSAETSSKPATVSPVKKPASDGSVAASDPVVVQPELRSTVTAVEPSVDVAMKGDHVRGRDVVPADAPDKAAAAAMDAEALLATSPLNTEAATASAAGGLTNSHAGSAAVSTPSHVSQQVLTALAAYEAELPQGGSRSFEMLLDPPELGRLLIQMSRTSKGVELRIAAENETVRSLLETTGGELQQNLQLSGFDLGQFSGSSTGGSFAGGEEWVAAPTLQSFASGSSPVRPTPAAAGQSAVNVIV